MSDPSNAVATRNASVQLDEVNLINKELHKLEEERASQFPQKRATLLRRLNSVQASTRVFPPETLSYIIQHVQNSHHADRYSRIFSRIILKLGHVSSHWRQIVWSTPQLWSDLVMDVYNHNIHTVVPFLQLHLQNVGSLLLDVDFFFPSKILSMGGSLDSIVSVLFHETNAAKIRSLCFHGAPWEWAPQLNNPNFSSLKCLDLTAFQGQRQDPDVLDLTELPCLHDVVVKGIRVIPTAINFCWSKITSLELETFCIDTCLKLLTCCPNLIEFRCLYPIGRVNNLSITPNHRLHDIITLNHLEIFEWTHDDDPCCLEVFRHLRLPALRDLSWNSEYESEVENPALLTLASNLPQALPSLTFICSEWTAPFVKDVFKQIGRVERLLLDHCSEITVANVFYTLTEDTDAGDHPMLLSSLKTLVIQGVFEDDASFDQVIGLLIFHFLQKRFRKGCLELHLEFLELSMDWLSEFQEELCWMRREGFKLEIYHESKRLDWFGAA